MNTQSWKRVNLGGAGRSREEQAVVFEFKRKQVVLA